MAALEAKAAIFTTYPDAITEHANRVRVGRVVLPERKVDPWIPDETFLRFFNALNGKTEESVRIRRAVVFDLNNNTPTRTAAVAHERALSAYFTFNPTPGQETVILEWGTIDSAGDAKLHTYLNQVIDYRARTAQGMQLSSGHLARVVETETYLAYLDRLSIRNEFAPNDPMSRMINTLHSHGFIPLTSEGFVQIPFF